MNPVTAWIENRWSHIVYGAKKNLVDLAAFLAPIQKQLAPLEQAELDTVVSTVTPILIAGLQNKTKGLDIAHSAGNAVESQLPELALKLGTAGISAVIATIQAAHTQAAAGDTAPPPAFAAAPGA